MLQLVMFFYRSRENAFLFLTQGLLFSIFLSLGIVRFHTNDDYGFFFISNGQSYGYPSDQLLFVGRIIGYLVSFLESNFPWMNWYPSLMAASTLFAISIFFKVCLNLNRKVSANMYFWLSLIGFTFFGSLFLFRLQFTQTALLCAAAGTFLFLNRHSKFDSLVAFLLLALGISWRLEAGLLGTFLVFFVYFVVQGKSFFPVFLRKSPLVFLGLLVFAGCNVLLWNKFSFVLSNEERNYLNYDALRGQLHGTRYLESMNAGKFASTVGLSPNDWELFRNFYFANKEVFSLETLRLLVSNSNSNGLVEKFSNLSGFFKDVLIAQLPIIAYSILLSSTFFINTKVKQVLHFWICIFIPVFFIYCIARMPSRVLLPILFVSCFLFFILRQLNPQKIEMEDSLPIHSFKIEYAGKNKIVILKSSLTQIFLSLTILFVGGLILYDVSKQVFISNVVEGENLNSLRTYQSDKPIIAFPSFYSPIIHVSPFSNTKENLSIWSSIIPFGTTIGSPDFVQNLKDKGISQDLFGSILDGDAYLGVTSQSEVELVKVYLKEHYSFDVGFVAILKTNEDLFGRTFQILKIKTV
jgi:hypothetical protein